jgi:hypothetical protein
MAQLLTLAQLLAATATAIATAALVYFTRVLARETRRLSDATAQPFVIATIEPNQWSLRHLDLRLENTGNAPAFDARLEVTPRIGQQEPSHRGGVGLDEIDILRPTQHISSYVAEWETAMDETYRCTVSWKRTPSSIERESLAYSIDVKKFKKMSRLGASSPLHQVADEVKRIREDWKFIAQGQRCLQVETQSKADRPEARRHDEARLGNVTEDSNQTSKARTRESKTDEE